MRRDVLSIEIRAPIIITSAGCAQLLHTGEASVHSNWVAHVSFGCVYNNMQPSCY